MAPADRTTSFSLLTVYLSPLVHKNSTPSAFGCDDVEFRIKIFVTWASVTTCKFWRDIDGRRNALAPLCRTPSCEANRGKPRPPFSVPVSCRSVEHFGADVKFRSTVLAEATSAQTVLAPAVLAPKLQFVVVHQDSALGSNH
uniref:Uncharacterized protein n=1 Tax=Romanomermis culicivorax TaxID=13658 RepID=A0A915JIG8_ROMCU